MTKKELAQQKAEFRLTDIIIEHVETCCKEDLVLIGLTITKGCNTCSQCKEINRLIKKLK